MSQKVGQTEKFLTDNEQLNERINILESNQLNNQWKDHYQKIDRVHDKRTKRVENHVKEQAEKHNKWLS